MSGPNGPNENAGPGGADPTQFAGQQPPAPQWGQQQNPATPAQPWTGPQPQAGPADPTQWGGQQQQPPQTGPADATQFAGQQPQPLQQSGPADPTQFAGQQQQPQTPPADATQWGGQQQAGQQWGSSPAQPQDPTQWGGQPQAGQQPWGGQPGPDQWGQQQNAFGAQQQYGQYQQYPQQQSSGGGKSKAPLMILLGVVALAVIGGIVAAVLMFMSKDKLDQNAAQDGVKKVLDESYGIKDISDVKCGADMQVKIGNTYDCELKVSGDAKKVQLKITKDDGTYEVSRPKS